jgi:thiamine kinase-like enzyme
MTAINPQNLKSYTVQEIQDEVLPGLLPLMVERNFPTEIDYDYFACKKIGGGLNNIVYHCLSSYGDIAVKWTVRDERDRAGREFVALSLLQEQHPNMRLAPIPIFLERDRYPLPVVVQSWENADFSHFERFFNMQRHQLAKYLHAIHEVKPSLTSRHLPKAVMTMFSATEGIASIYAQLARFPESEQMLELKELLARLETQKFPIWNEPEAALCRCDANITNFGYSLRGWLSVDWEYSGWGDPAFEVADILTHPSFASMPLDERREMLDLYCSLADDKGSAERSAVYQKIMSVWWVARLNREFSYMKLKERPDTLVTRPSDWLEQVQANYDNYVQQAFEWLK